MSSSAGYDVICFDLDGTLTDSAPGIIACLQFALDELGIEHPDPQTMRSHLGPPLVATFGEHYGLDHAQTARAIAAYRSRYHDVGLFENSVYDGIPELLDALGELPVTLAVATSKPTESATRILRHFDLDTRFAFIGGAQMAGPRQHKADVIAHTLDELAAAGRWQPRLRTVMVGDREHDIRGAHAHGLPAIGVLWGYGDEPELTRAGAAAVASNPAILLEELRRPAGHS